MRIKKLEIHGFKSFADKASLVFGDGISGVVGPNGCGKSNVVDAIRWCMGEMSAKHLRGKAMQDVIFAGSDSRGPQNLAEVTLTFHNDGNAPPAYAAYEEIAITRRLFRDGTSEYLINKIPARLRDITDFFLGTGVGTRAYSIIEQGRIGFIVNSKPEERRSLIEEVAGITKFKARKKAAERRMDATQQNLLRVNDIISELERQLGSLRRQARKAEKYRELRSELRDLELHGAAVDILRMAALEKYQLRERDKLRQRLDEKHEIIGKTESSIESERVKLLDDERRLQEQQEMSAEAESRFAALERDLQHWQRQLEDTRVRAIEAQSDVEDSRRRVEHAEGERAELSQIVVELSGSFGDDQGRLEGLSAAASKLQEELHGLDQEVERLRARAVENIHGAAQQRSMLDTLERQRADTLRRLESASSERSAVTESRIEIESKRAALAEEVARRESQLEAWATERDQLRAELERVVPLVAAAVERVDGLKDTLGQKRSRLNSLEEIARRLEGFSDGVRTLMADDARGALPGIDTLVPEILEAPSELEVAVEAALGDRLHYLIVDGHETARAAVDYLRTHAGGRGGFVPRAAPSAAPVAVPTAPGVVGRVLDLVTVQDGYDAAANALLGDVIVVEDLDAALLCGKEECGARFVTRDGTVVESRGAITGGTTEGAGLLANRREIRELTELVAALEARLDDARAELAEVSARRSELEGAVQGLDGAIRQAELEKLERSKDLQAAETDTRRLADRLEVLGYELEQHRDELAMIEENEAEARSAAGVAEDERTEIESAISGAQSQRKTLGEQFEARSQELTRLRVDLAAREEKLSSSRSGVERLTRALEELAARISRGEEVVEEARAFEETLSQQIASGREQLEEIGTRAEDLRTSVAALRENYERERGGLSDAEQLIREKRRESELLQEALTELKIDLQRMSLEREQLVEHVAERHDVDLLTVLTDYHTRSEPSRDDVQRRKDLDRQIKNMGPINLTAIEECREIEERYEFLTGQRDDLNEALENLRRAIHRINRASRERFKEAYDAVNEMFQKVYPRLFRGGVARLDLTDSDDLLDAGVEIVAQPPGKKLQSVGLMSGGEKALTATAFIFAIFLIKPSPFCILDEVDAPLDEANVGRFNEMLREISSISQFIVITHNKNTMTQADKLYGITMEEPGMSKVVRVDLDEYSDSEESDAA